MANILYISLTGMTEPLGESQVVQYLLDLSQQHTIFLLSFEKSKDKLKYEAMQKRLTNANIQWKFLEYSNRYGVLSTGWQMTKALFLSSQWTRTKNIQIIHARSIIPATIGMLLKKFFNVKLLFDIRGFAIDEKILEGRLKTSSLLSRFLKKLELYLYQHSDHVVTLTHISKPIIHEKYGVKAQDITVIPTCANIHLFQKISPLEKNILKERIGFAKDDRIVLHHGSLNGGIDFAASLKLFAQLAQLDAQIRFLFLNKDQHPLILSQLAQYPIKKSHYQILSIDYDQVSQYLNIADICVFFIKSSFAKLASAPTKFAELMACHLPVVTNTQYGDMEYYLNAYQVGILLDLPKVHADPQDAALKVIEFIKRTQNNKANHTQDFSQLFETHFSKEIAVKKYDAIYHQLINLHRPHHNIA